MRVELWGWLGRKRPKTVVASGGADAGVRALTDLELGGTGKHGLVLVGLLGALGTRLWACPSVTAAVATAARRSAATGSRQRRQGSYGAEEVNEEEQGMKKLTARLTRRPVTV